MSGLRNQPQRQIRLARSGITTPPCGAFVPTLGGLRLLGEGKRDDIARPWGPNIGVYPGPHGLASRPANPTTGVYAATTNSFRLNAVANRLDTVWERPKTQVTVLVVFRRLGNPPGNSIIFANEAAQTTPFQTWGFTDNGSAATTSFSVANNGTTAATVLTVPLVNNVLQVMIGRYDGAEMKVWQNGVLVGTLAAAGALTYANSTARGPTVGNYYSYTAQNRAANMEIYGGAVWDVAVSDAEIAALSQNPWLLFDNPEDDDDFFLQAASGVHSSIVVTPASLLLSGGDVGMRVTRRADVQPAALALTGSQVRLSVARRVGVTLAALLATGREIALTVKRSLGVQPATLATGAGNVGMKVGRQLRADRANLTLNLGQVGLAASRRLTVAPLPMTVTGSSIQFEYTPKPVAGSYVMSFTPAELVLTGGAVGMRVIRKIQVAAASYALTGQPVAVRDSATGTPIDAATIPAARTVIFSGGRRTAIFSGGQRVVIFNGGTRVVDFNGGINIVRF